MSAVKPLPLLLITPIFILLAHYLAVFPHEYAHATMAWILGFKNNPFNIIYGGKSVGNIFLLSHVDENVNYKMIYDAGYRDYISMIAFSGPGIGNGLLFIVSLVLLKNTVVKKHSYFYYFLFWFNLMNLGNFYDYVPIRTFASSGDVFNFVFGINISPWWVFIFAGYLVAFLIIRFYQNTLIQVYDTLILSCNMQKFVLVLATFILFGFFGGFLYVMLQPDFMQKASTEYLLSVISMVAIPGILCANWPTRSWVKNALQNQ